MLVMPSCCCFSPCRWSPSQSITWPQGACGALGAAAQPPASPPTSPSSGGETLGLSTRLPGLVQSVWPRNYLGEGVVWMSKWSEIARESGVKPDTSLPTHLSVLPSFSIPHLALSGWGVGWVAPVLLHSGGRRRREGENGRWGAAPLEQHRPSSMRLLKVVHWQGTGRQIKHSSGSDSQQPWAPPRPLGPGILCWFSIISPAKKNATPKYMLPS